MTKINLLEDSNTEILKKRVQIVKDKIRPLEKHRGNHVTQFIDFVKHQHSELDKANATRLFKCIISTWDKTAPKMFVVDLLESFGEKVVENAQEEAENPAQTKIA